MLRAGIVGLPNVGKSTLFNAVVANAKAEAANFPFCTIEPNVGIVSVPDDRLEVLAKISSAKQIVPARVEFVDIAGLVLGASKGEGLGNLFLSNIRETDAIVHVVRCFDLADLAQVERRMERTKKQARANKDAQYEMSVLEKVAAELNEGKSVRQIDLSEEEAEIIKPLTLLSAKKIIYAANVSEDD